MDQLCKKLGIGILICTLFCVSACQIGSTDQEKVRLYSEELESQHPHKKVILMILDSMNKELVDRSIQSGNSPALQFLVEQGQYYKEVVTQFPSMSVTIESSLLTGAFPDRHKIPGLSWYNAKENRIVNYGTSIAAVRKNGISQSVYDALYNLNLKHLSSDVKTLYEELDEKGITSGAINTLVYRGNHEHLLQLPFAADQALDLPREIKVKGPNVLTFGRLIPSETLKSKNLPDQPWKRFGVQNELSVKALTELIKARKQPDFTMLYLPNFDQQAHEHGPDYLAGFEQVDTQLQQLLNSYEAWEDALKENIIILLGDHSQDQIKARGTGTAIDLQQMFSGYQIADLDADVQNKEVALGVNERSAYIYDVSDLNLIPELVSIAATDQRVGIIAWQENDWVYVRQPAYQDVLRFKPDGKWEDIYHQTWAVEGNPRILDLTLQHAQNRLTYSDYPDALQQLYTALNSHEGEKLVLSAQPGYSFRAAGIPVHYNGGDHGGLHRNDMLTAMIIAGTDQKPQTLRLVDLKEYVLQFFTTSPEPKPKPIRMVKTKSKQKSLPHQIKKKAAQQAQEYAKGIRGVTDAVAVVVDQDVYVSLKVEQWHRLRLKSLRKEAYDLLVHRFKDHRIHVSTDWKIYRELLKLSKQSQHASPEDVRKKTKDLEKKIKG